ncbi:MAG: transposase [Cyanobacteriota bacterium]|nr:transposase [Cyanobacteriota bacterium]
MIPRYNARLFESVAPPQEAVEFITEVEPEPAKKTDKALAIDLGLNNLATCVSNTGSSFILSGRKLKSINQWYNKENLLIAVIKG